MTENTLLKPEQINSKFFKKELSHYLKWKLNYPIVIDEYEFIDILGINRSEYAVEFEIKVSKSDFDREVKIINSPEPKFGQYGKDYTKWRKHQLYLTGELPKSNYDLRMESLGINAKEAPWRPNDFYFYVPDYLADYATSKLQGYPYGVVSIGKEPRNTYHEFYWPYNIIKKAKRLHQNKIDGLMYKKLAHSLCIRTKLFI